MTDELLDAPDVSVDTRPRFLDDIRAAVDVCRAQPKLPLLTFGYGCVSAVVASGHPSARLLALPAYLLLGWLGVERLWFLRAFDGGTLAPGELRHGMRTYLGRFSALGFLVGLVLLPLSGAFFIVVMRHRDVAANGAVSVHLPWWGYVVGAAVGLAADFLMTFMTPALVYSTTRAREAFGIGLRTLRRTWPHSAKYVLIPPFAIVAFSRIAGSIGGIAAGLLVVSTMANLVAKGATARYYLRLSPPLLADGLISPQMSPVAVAASSPLPLNAKAFDCRVCDPAQLIGRHDMCSGVATRVEDDTELRGPCLCAAAGHHGPPTTGRRRGR